eukprot:TRINITY_DN2883_c0_g2_i1.p1 TRINITY_DN2883_c0_g2~~TRINITY_DN2883_c0_g2_i1.p1  ORF type:complete len:533 (+),score=183.21 TRINITY_DN2883_c0_g2_i1:132-1730(+)
MAWGGWGGGWGKGGWGGGWSAPTPAAPPPPAPGAWGAPVPAAPTVRVGPGGIVVAGGPGAVLAATVPRPVQQSYNLDDLKVENEVLCEANAVMDTENERMILANDVLRAKVRGKEKEILQVHEDAMADLRFAKNFIEHEKNKLIEEELAQQRALEEEAQRANEEQELRTRLANMTEEERRAYYKEKERAEEEERRKKREEEEKQRLEEEQKRLHQKRIIDWCDRHHIQNQAIVEEMLKLTAEQAHDVMRGTLATALDREAVVLARIRKHRPQEKVRLCPGISPGQVSEDPALCNDALLRLYCQVMSISLPATDTKYENFLTKATMVLQSPNGNDEVCTVRVPGRNPDKQMMRELVCGETMGCMFPGLTRDEILSEMEKMKHTQALLRQEKVRKQEQRTYGKSGAITGSNQLAINDRPGLGGTSQRYSMLNDDTRRPDRSGGGRSYERGGREYSARDDDRSRRDRDRDRERGRDEGFRERDRDRDRDRERDRDRDRDRRRDDGRSGGGDRRRRDEEDRDRRRDRRADDDDGRG